MNLKALLSLTAMAAAAGLAHGEPAPAKVQAAKEYIFLVHACKRVEARAGTDLQPCVTTGASRLASTPGDSASASNYRHVTLQQPMGAGAPQEPGTEPAPVAARIGYEFTLKPLSESDGVVYVQYGLTATRLERWVPDEAPSAKGGHFVPDLQETRLSGTDRVRLGQAFRVNRSGYSFEVKLLSAQPLADNY